MIERPGGHDAGEDGVLRLRRVGRFGGKGKDKRNAPGEEVTEDGNKEEGLRHEFAEKLLLSSPPPKSIAPPVMQRYCVCRVPLKMRALRLLARMMTLYEHEREEVFGKRVQFSSEGFRSAVRGIFRRQRH